MKKNQFFFAGLAFALLAACSSISPSNQIGLRENWIDERDMMALMGTPMDEWMQKVGRPTLVEISGDTSIYYYNYRPTLYTAVAYDGGKTEEAKPSLANATEVWGSRKNLMQIKIVQNAVVSAVVAAGPDKKSFVRDLNGNLVVDPKSGYTPNYSEEIKVKGDFNEFIKEYSRLNVKTEPAAAASPENAPAPIADSAAAHAAPASQVHADSAAAHAAPHAVPASATVHSDSAAAHAAPHAVPASSSAHADSAAAAHAAPHAVPASPAAPHAAAPAVPAAHAPTAPAIPAPSTPAAAPAIPAAAPKAPATAAPAAPVVPSK